MDYGNSDVRCLVRFGADGSHVAPVRTFECQPGAKIYPGWHAFGFPWWEGDEETRDFVGPGFTEDFEKRRNRVSESPGQHYHGLRTWFENGIPDWAWDLTGDALPPRDCEAYLALDVQDTDDTGLLADYPDCSILQFNRSKLIRVVVGHTSIQQVVEFVGVNVGNGVSTAFDEIYTLLFPGATVSVVGPNTVSVETGGGAPPLMPGIGGISGGAVTTPLHPADSGSVLLGIGLPGEYLFQLPHTDVLVPGYYLWAHVAEDSTGPLIVEPPFGELIDLDGVLASALVLEGPGTALWECFQVVGTTSFWRTLLPAGGSGSGTLTIGSTPVSGAADGELLRVGPTGTLDAITFLDGGTFP